MAFFDHTMSAVRVGGEISDWFEVFSGSGQGNIQGPPLFNVCLNWIMELAMKFKVVSEGALLQKREGSRDDGQRVLGRIPKNKGIRLHTKMRIYKSDVLTIVTYGCEVWNTTQTQNRRIESFHQSCLRRILKVRWFHISCQKWRCPDESAHKAYHQLYRC